MSATNTFRALVTRAKKTPAKVEFLRRSDLPGQSTVKKFPGECDLTISVEFSNLNYKDALVVSGTYPGLSVPMVGGIDLAGTVVERKSDCRFQVGDSILVNGCGIGTDHFGGFSELACISSDWAIGLPAGLSTLDAARIGTAGYTAMLCVESLQQHGVKPGNGPVLVTGSTGGVGSVATVLLSEMGYDVVALTGKVSSAEAWLKELGAKEVSARSEMEGEPKALGKELYAGCVDTVGDKVLANALSQIKYNGAVAACGLAGGMSLNTTVAPFILRGVTLAGIDSVFNPAAKREEVYKKFTPLLLASGKLDLVSDKDHMIGLEEVPGMADRMLKGQNKGRYVVDFDLKPSNL